MEGKDEVLNLAAEASHSPLNFMTAENRRGQITSDKSVSPPSRSFPHWAAAPAGAPGIALSRAVRELLPSRSRAKGIMPAQKHFSPRVQRLALRCWRLDGQRWMSLDRNMATSLAEIAEISEDFLKIVLKRSDAPICLGLLNSDGFGPIVMIPHFLDGLEVTFLSKALFFGSKERTYLPGGDRIPVALATPRNPAAADLLSTLSSATTEGAEAIWEQAAPGLVDSGSKAIDLLAKKFAQPAEALLAAHYLLRFLPNRLPLAWVDSLVRAQPEAADAPVVAAWTRLLNPPTNIDDSEIDADVNHFIALALDRPVVLFARTRVLLFDALRVMSNKPLAMYSLENQGTFRRFAADAGGLESFWGCSPTEPGACDRPRPDETFVGLVNDAFELNGERRVEKTQRTLVVEKKPATIDRLLVGESLVGEGNEVAHIDLIMGPRGSAAETAFANALTNNRDGFTSLLAVVAPNLPVKPNTILFNKVMIRDAKQAKQMFGPAQHAVAMAVADAVAEGTIPAAEADDIFICVGVFIHLDASEDKKIHDYNYKATKESIERAVKGTPKAADVQERKKTSRHPFSAA
jgi:5,6,7,8-tetrahydromethanopterin hydro-lyase